VRSSETEATENDGIGSGLAANVVALGLAASAGVHAGLVPEHLRETPQAGMSFALAGGLLLAVAAWLAHRPRDWRAVRVGQVLIAGSLVAYLSSRTVGIPVLQPEVEHPDALGVSTKAVEVLVLLSALRLGRTLGGRRSSASQEVAT
jgi:hypothetical protein